MNRCTSSSILRSWSDLCANMANCWLQVQLWVTLQCTITHLCSMQYSLWVQFVADQCHIPQWCKNVNIEEGNKMHGYTDVDHFSSSISFIFSLIEYVRFVFEICFVWNVGKMSDWSQNLKSKVQQQAQLLQIFYGSLQHKTLHVNLLYSSHFQASTSFYSGGCADICNQRHWISYRVNK